MTNHLFDSIDEAQEFLEQQFGKNETFDFGMEHLFIKDMPVLCTYITGLTDSETLAVLLANFVPDSEVGLSENDSNNDSEKSPQDPQQADESSQKASNGDPHKEKKFNLPEQFINDNDYFETYFNFHGRRRQVDRDKLLLSILSGQIAFITQNGYVFVVELRKYPGRNPEEPDNEKVVRGARDGFTESINMNTALVRRRVRTPKLRFELHQISKIGKTDMAIAYLNDLVNEEHLDWLRQRINQIDHDGLTMADKLLEEWLFKQSFHPVPFVRYTERPDIAAAHLLEGHIVILVDTSPSVIIVPVTMFHLLQHAEEYRQAPAIGSLVRFFRHFGTAMSLLLLPFWYLFATNPELLPKSLDFLGTKDPSSVPLLLQIFIAELGIEFLRMAAIHTPTPLSTAMGLIAGVIIGQIAIEVGLFSSEVVLYSAITAIFTFAIPSYELSISVKVFRILLLIATGMADQNGLFIAMLLTFLYLSSLKPMSVPYMWPLVPFFPTAFLRVFLRFPITNNAPRPYVVGAKQRKRS